MWASGTSGVLLNHASKARIRRHVDFRILAHSQSHLFAANLGTVRLQKDTNQNKLASPMVLSARDLVKNRDGTITVLV
jgi:hypothetical protein